MRKFPGHWAYKDFLSRQSVAENEITRRAYLYIARNVTVDPTLRAAAQMKLNNMPRNTRPTTVKERCTLTGRGGGVFTKVGLCRHRFKLNATAGNLPGISKASW